MESQLVSQQRCQVWLFLGFMQISRRIPWKTGVGSRPVIPSGTVRLTARVDEQVTERRKIIFNPVPRVDGMDPSGELLTEVRSDIYLLSGRRRRAAGAK